MTTISEETDEAYRMLHELSEQHPWKDDPWEKINAQWNQTYRTLNPESQSPPPPAFTLKKRGWWTRWFGGQTT